MLTCINPSVSFKTKLTGSQHHNGVAISLKWLLALVKRFGRATPPNTKSTMKYTTSLLEMEKGDKKQYFNKLPNGTTITRAGGGVEAVSRSCVLVKRSAFRPESWKVFSEGIFMQLFYFFVTAKGYY